MILPEVREFILSAVTARGKDAYFDQRNHFDGFERTAIWRPDFVCFVTGGIQGT